MKKDKKDIALHLREQSKRIDLPIDVIRTFCEAYAEIVSLEMNDEMNKSIIRRLQQQPECSTIANFIQDEINRLTKERHEALKKLSQYSMDKLAQLDEELGL